MQNMEQLLLLMTFISSALLFVYSVVREYYWSAIVSFAVLSCLLILVLISWINDLISKKYSKKLPNLTFGLIPIIALLFTVLIGSVLR